jgi:uncharacterized phiE125 gp8 family phage protein
MGNKCALTLSSGPSEEPVTLTEAKTHLRVTEPDDDTYIESLITAARQMAESFTGRALVTQTWVLTLDRFPGSSAVPIEIPLPELQSISSITYNDSNGDSQTWASSNYTVDIKNKPGRVLPIQTASYPTTQGHINDVTVTFVAGYGSASSVPETIKQAIKIYIGHLYERREETIVGAVATLIPEGAKALLWRERVIGL